MRVGKNYCTLSRFCNDYKLILFLLLSLLYYLLVKASENLANIFETSNINTAVCIISESELHR